MEKLLAFASLGQAIYGRWRLQRLVATVIIVAVLTLVTAVIISALVIGGFYGAYLLLLHYGVEPATAMVTIYAALLILAITMVLMLHAFFTRLRQLQQRLLNNRIPLTTRVTDRLGELMDAFLDGFLAK